jgi:hypothetical protein
MKTRSHKTIIYIIGLIFTCYYCESFAQGSPPPYYGNIEYSYDATGNRIQRKVAVQLMVKPNNNPNKGTKAGAAVPDSIFAAEPTSTELETEMRKAMKYGISVFPNPAQTDVNITINSLQSGEKANLIMYDEVGRTVFTKEQTQPLGQVNISNQESGVYYLRIQMSDGEILLYKIVKAE